MKRSATEEESKGHEQGERSEPTALHHTECAKRDTRSNTSTCPLQRKGQRFANPSSPQLFYYNDNKRNTRYSAPSVRAACKQLRNALPRHCFQHNECSSTCPVALAEALEQIPSCSSATSEASEEDVLHIRHWSSRNPTQRQTKWMALFWSRLSSLSSIQSSYLLSHKTDGRCRGTFSCFHVKYKRNPSSGWRMFASHVWREIAFMAGRMWYTLST